MPYSAWPFECPNSWQEVPQKPVIRSEVEDGPTKVRRRFTKVMFKYEVSFRLPWSDYEAFWEFWRMDCGGGSIPMTIEHPVTKKTIIVRFADEPKTQSNTNLSKWFDLSCTLELQFN